MEKKDGYGAEQSFLISPKNKILDILVRALTSCDIPLKNLRNEEFKELFDFLVRKTPSETTIRKYVSDTCQRYKKLL